MLTATCHCGAVKVQVPRKPNSLTDCNCSICRRYGVLWAYYKDAEVQLIADPGTADEYIWGNKTQGNPVRVTIFLAEKGIDVPFVPVDLFAGAHKHADYLAKNPTA